MSAKKKHAFGKAHGPVRYGRDGVTLYLAPSQPYNKVQALCGVLVHRSRITRGEATCVTCIECNDKLIEVALSPVTSSPSPFTALPPQHIKSFTPPVVVRDSNVFTITMTITLEET